MAAPSAWTLYDQFKLNLGKKLIDLSSDTIKMALFTSASNAGTLTTSPGTYATLTNEVSNANGYTTAGVTLATVTWTNSAGTETFTSGTATWNATGAGITARYAVIYDSTSGHIICVSTLDSTPADVVIAPGNALTLQINTSGIFTAS